MSIMGWLKARRRGRSKVRSKPLVQAHQLHVFGVVLTGFDLLEPVSSSGLSLRR